jgi:hypothetical protein
MNGQWFADAPRSRLSPKRNCWRQRRGCRFPEERFSAARNQGNCASSIATASAVVVPGVTYSKVAVAKLYDRKNALVAAETIRMGRTRRQHNHRNRAAVANLPESFEPVEQRHHHVEYNQIESTFERPAGRFATVMDRFHADIVLR